MLNKLWSVFLSLIAGPVILAHDKYKQTARKVRYWRESASRSFRKFLDRQPVSIGLIKPGQWRVHYNDGAWSQRFTYDTATNYASIFGGTVHWVRYHDPVMEARNG